MASDRASTKASARPQAPNGPIPITGLDRFQGAWGPYLDGVFPASTIPSITEHFAREVSELIQAQGLNTFPPNAAYPIHRWLLDSGRARPPATEKAEIQGEIGDCLLLLLHLSHRWGVSFHQALYDTALKVQARTEAGAWGEVDAAGVVEHKRPARDVSPDAVPHLARIDAAKAIREERDHQIALGWTPDHDDSHTLADWIELIAERADAAYSQGGPVKEKLIQIGALAQAAVERMIRRELREAEGGS